MILAPMKGSRFDVDAWLARLERHRDIPFPNVPDDPPLAPNDAITFD